MVERELGDEARAARTAHARRLALMGRADDAALAAGIRDHSLDDLHGDVSEAVWEAVLAKVRVANPDYLLPEDR
jgi:hypothetical protein